MNSLESKSQQLAKFIATKVAELGLIFVDGPNTTPTTPVQPDPNTTSGQDRAGFYFAVAEPSTH